MIQQRKRRQKAITVAAYRQKHPTWGRALYRLRIDRLLCKGVSSAIGTDAVTHSGIEKIRFYPTLCAANVGIPVHSAILNQ